MAFRFRLEKVARFRRRLVEERSRDVAVAAREVARFEQREAALAADIARQRAVELAASAPGRLVTDMMARTRWLAHLEDLREDAARALELARLAMEARRRELEAAWRDLEVLETLRRKRQAEWEAEQARRESAALDEVGQIRAARAARSKLAS